MVDDGEHSANLNIENFSRLEIVQKVLKLLCRTTGLRIALVARVTEETWTAYAVVDEANFGLKPGDNLELQTTF